MSLTQNKTGILLVGLAGLWYWVLRGVNALSVKFEQLRVVGITPEYTSYNTSVILYNPLLISLLINDIVGEIYVMDIPCGTINYPLNQRIKSRGKSRVQIDFNIYSSELGSALYANIQTGDIQTLFFRFKGYITVNNVRLKIEKEFTFNELIGR